MELHISLSHFPLFFQNAKKNNAMNFCGNQSVVDNLKYVHRRLGTCLKIKSELHIVATHNNPITKSGRL